MSRGAGGGVSLDAGMGGFGDGSLIMSAVAGLGSETGGTTLVVAALESGW